MEPETQGRELRGDQSDKGPGERSAESRRKSVTYPVVDRTFVFAANPSAPARLFQHCTATQNWLWSLINVCQATLSATFWESPWLTASGHMTCSLPPRLMCLQHRSGQAPLGAKSESHRTIGSARNRFAGTE